MRQAVVLCVALFAFCGVSAQTPDTSWIDHGRALLSYDKKLSTLENDLIDLVSKLSCDDQFICIGLERDVELTRHRIKTSMIISLMYREGTDQGAKFPRNQGEIVRDYVDTQISLGNKAELNKKMLASVKNPYLAQLGVEGIRIIEGSKEEIEKLYKAVRAPTGLF